jgi:DNA N-6-adenine-methyltransferase (Dam)
MNAIVRTTSRDLTQYDPVRGLQEIVVAEAVERHWKRAKDVVQLMVAVEAKIRGQADYVVWRDSVVPPTGFKDGKRFRSETLPAADPGRLTVHRWRKAFCKTVDDLDDDGKPRKTTIPDEDKISFELDEATQRCARLIEKENINTIRGTEGTGEFERFTPPQYIEAARLVLGEIDLDPASCAMAQKIVRAKKFYTIETDGLKQDWCGNVWLNGPFHRELLPAFVNKLVAEIDAGRVTQAIQLTNNCTETDWFGIAMRACSSMCFKEGRICFLQPQGNEIVPMGSPTQGQVFFYYGKNPERFDDVFESIGMCVPRIFFARSR